MAALGRASFIRRIASDMAWDRLRIFFFHLRCCCGTRHGSPLRPAAHHLHIARCCLALPAPDALGELWM